ncbi:MAG: hypothetical protein ABH827_01615 [bacterium]
MALNQAPDRIENYKEIAVLYNTNVTQLYNSLTPQERVFVYYLFRACLPGNRILADQLHRHGLEITNIFEHIINNQDKLSDRTKFLEQAKTFLVYLWTNHGQYFLREHSNEKRTPNKLGLDLLTQENILAVLGRTGFADAQEKLLHIAPALFDDTIEPTICVPGSIADSAVNIYAPDFTEQDYSQIPVQDQSKLNAYFYVEHNGQRMPKSMVYSVDGKYGQELTVSAYWFKKAYEHAQKYTQNFDEHIIKSLELLIKYLESGDEEYFKQHSIEWLKSSSKIDYNFGFIENYSDPKSQRGFFQAEATIRSVDIGILNKLLPELEKRMPLFQEFKREKIDSIPNASINEKIFGVGELGPMFITAAYCLPNYSEIRSQYGSKQIMYPATKGLAAMKDPELARALFNVKNKVDWLNKHDQDGKLARDIWDLQCILHETIGHGSGRLATHTFKEGENLTVSSGDKQTHSIGDTINVTSTNICALLDGYENTIEELRAEIISLYISVFNLPEILACGFLSDWTALLSQDELETELILAMAGTGLRRYMQQSDGATEIAGEHALANCTIMNFLVDHGCLEFVEEQVLIKDKSADKTHTVIGLRVKDLAKAKEYIKNLMVDVQVIKSTGNIFGAKGLIETYGRPLRHPEYMRILKDNQQAIVGDLKVFALIYPHFVPVLDKAGKEIVDIQAVWPRDIFEQYKNYEKIELACE